MPRVFRFRLERLLEIRRVQEDLKKKEFAQARRAVHDQQKSILSLLIEEDKMKGELRGIKMKTETMNLADLRLQEQYLNSLARRIIREYRQLTGLSKGEAAARRELMEAAKGVRVLERVRERREKEHNVEVDREERKMLDEIAQRMKSLSSHGRLGRGGEVPE